jgi:predicted  nucleic acid-binding Zn-ribbon protein
MMSAPATQQWQLLDVQDHDTRLAQLAHRQRTLPEHAELERLHTRHGALADDTVLARTVAGDIARELAKAESDVEQVRRRAARDRDRLETGQASAKDLQGLQHELQTLAARQEALEDVELEIMERAEAADRRVAELAAGSGRLAGELAAAERALAERLQDLDGQAAVERAARDAASSGLPPDLLALYERIRAGSAGIGAARLARRRCDGCRLELNATDLGRIRTAADDEVIRCEECGRILVRTADSGL